MNALAAPVDKAVHGAVFAPAVLTAPAHWRCVDFIADLHLQAGDQANFAAWRDFMRGTQADAVFILGDLFEVWVGDDAIHDSALAGGVADRDPEPGFAARCAQVIQDASRSRAVYFMHGNRDFLLGPDFAKTCGMTLLDDPTVIAFAGQRWLLSHGDALCLQDTDYMQFRARVRDAQWQQMFLAKPLSERQSIGRELRAQSEARRQRDALKGTTPADLDIEATRRWLRAAGATTLIHGHTHRPAEHDMGDGMRRIVLSDWDAAARPRQPCVLRLDARSPNPAQPGASLERLAVTSA